MVPGSIPGDGRDPADDALGGRIGYAGVLALPVGAVVDRPYVYE